MPPVRRAPRRSPASASPAAKRTAVPASVPAGMSTPIQSVTQGRSSTLAVCVYADPGIGKTVLAGSCGDMGKTLIVRPPVDHTDSITNKEVDEWVVRTWSDMDDVMLYIRNEGGRKYEWVWLDSLSLWQDQGLDDIWEQVITKKPHRAEYGLDKGEYGVNMKRIGTWIRDMVGSPDFHFGVTCHPRQAASTEDEDNPNNKLMPWVQGRMMAPKICGYMNVVGYLHREDIRTRRVRVLELMETDKFYAKVGFPGWDTQRLINPTMPQLVQALKATGTEAADAVNKRATPRKAKVTKKTTRRTK